MASRARIAPAALFGIATVFGISSTFQAWGLVHLRPAGETPAFTQVLLLNLIYWYVPALLAPAIMGFAKRNRLRRAGWAVQAAVHAAGALTYAVFHTSLMVASKTLILDVGRVALEPDWWRWVLHEFLMQLDWLLMTYLFFVGLAYAFAFRDQSEAAALNTANLETRLVEAQFQALQRQLHPHFLFNTLNTIAGLVHSDPRAADLMLDRLGDLLRMTLHTSGMQEVRLEEELEVVQKYLEIEQTRFGDRLRVSMDIAPDTLDALVPNLLLQPLVENAIRHGIAPKARPGWVTVRAARQGDALAVEVRDSGDGLSPERLVALNRGVGLDNTRARLQHLYRDRFQFVFSNTDEGFCVSVTIPFQLDTSAPAARIA